MEQPFRHLRLGLRPDPGRSQRSRTRPTSWACRSASRPTAARPSRASAARGGDNHAPVDRPGQLELPHQGLRPGRRRVLRQGPELALLPERAQPSASSSTSTTTWRRPFKVYGSMQDHGSFRGKVDLSRGRDRIPAQEFENAPGGEGSNHAVDPTNPNIVYSAGFYGTISRAEYDKPGPYPGCPFTQGAPARPLRERAAPARPMAGPVHPFAAQPEHPLPRHAVRLPLARPGRHLGEDQPRPDDQRRRRPAATSATRRSSPSPSRRIKYGLLYAGTDDGRLWVTKDGGKAWTEITAGLAPGKWMSRVVASAYDLGTVYLTQNGKRDDDFTPYVWKSTDYGKTWTSLAKGIPVGPVNVIREDPVRRGHPLRRDRHGRLRHRPTAARPGWSSARTCRRSTSTT